MKKIVAMCGSMREESNTNKLVKKAAEASGCDFELVELGRMSIKPCTGCSMCMMNEGQCPIDDDMQAVYDKLIEADGLIISGPTYFLDISGAVKDFIDRTMAIRYRGVGPEYNPDMPWLGNVPLADKPTVLIVTVAGGGHERAIESLKLAFDDCHKVNIVAQQAEPVGMNDVDDMPEVLQRAEETGKKLGAALQ